MGDATWRLVVALYSGETVVVPVRVYDPFADSHPDLSWFASCEVNSQHFSASCRDQFDGQEVLAYLFVDLHRNGYFVREVVPPGEPTAAERVAAIGVRGGPRG